MARKLVSGNSGRQGSPREKTELEKTVAAATKKYGPGVVVPGSSILQPRRIPTGIFTLDAATLGGIPYNRCTMIFGPKHAGKSSVSSRIVGIVQKMDEGKVVWMDIEGTADPVWMAKLGVDVDELLIAQPETGEIAIDMAIALIESLEVSMVVIDSVAALVPFKEYDGSAEDQNVGLQARLIASFIRKLVPALIKERLRGHFITVIFLNQYRCIANDTPIKTNRGVIPFGTVQVSDYVESPSGYSKVLAVVDSGELDGVELTVRGENSTRTIKLSYNHLHMVVGYDGDIVQRFAQDIRKGDICIVSSSEERAEVTDIVKCRFAATDIEVEGGLFYANGILTHNSKIGGFSKFGGEPIQVPGGKSLGHCTSLEIDLKNYEVMGKAEDGTGIVDHNEHGFSIKKNKMNNGERTGAFNLIRDNSAHRVLPEGEVDDAATIVAFAKNMGIYQGKGGGKKVLTLDDGVVVTADKDADVIAQLDDDPEMYWLARTTIIRQIAENRGMSPAFLDEIESQKYLRLVRYYG